MKGSVSELSWLQHVICVILLKPQSDLLSTTAMGSRLLLAVLSSTIARSHAESPHLRQFMYCYIDFAGTPMQQAPAASTATGSQSQGPVVAPTLHKIINYFEYELMFFVTKALCA